MPQFPLVPQSEQDADNKSANTARMINCYLEPVGSEMVIKSTLGMSDFLTVPGVFFRAIEAVYVDGASRMYIAQGGRLYETFDSGGLGFSSSNPDFLPVGFTGNLFTYSPGFIEDSPETSISSNDNRATIVAGGKYYVVSASTLSEPAAGAFSDFGSVTYYNGRTVLTERNGQRVQWSNVFDPFTLDGLSFATADAFDDFNLRALTINGSLYIFKERSIEQWYQNGADLAPVASSAIEFGLKDYNLLTKVPNGAFFVSSQNKVMVMYGPQPQPLNHRGVETALAQSTPTNCFFYQDEGHDFCVVRFADRPAWVFDMATGLWHERSQGDFNDPWLAMGSAQFQDDWILPTNDGHVYSLERTNEDATGPLIRVVQTNTMRNDGNRFRVRRLEIEGRVGYSDLGRDAQIMLQMSKDGGETWTDPKPRSLGGRGHYSQRAVWRALGQYREATARLTWTDEAEIPISAIGGIDVA